MLNKTPLASALALAFAIPFATPVMAQTAPQPSTPAQATQSAPAAAENSTLPTISVSGQAAQQDFQAEQSTVGAKTPTALRDIPQSVTVINRSLLQSQGVTSFQDALRNAPGITIGGAEGGQIGNNINLRGFTAQNDIYLDGFRDRNQYYRDTFNLEAIEVLYGPSSMLFGRGSTGGVINQVSKKANLTPSTEVSGTLGTDDRYRTTIDVNRPIGDHAAFRINAFGQSMGTGRDEMRNKDYGIAPSVRFGIGTPTEITLSALIQHNRDMPDYGIPALNGHPAPVSRDTFYGLTDDRTIQDVQTLSARIEHKFSDDLKISNQTQFSHSRTDARETAPGAVLTGPLSTSPALSNGNYTNLPLSDLYVRLASHDRVIDNNSLYNDSMVQYRFNLGPVRNDVIAGVELGHETYTNQASSRTNLPVVSLVNPQYTSTPGNVIENPGNRAESGANEFAAYVNDTLSLGQHWKLIGGARWDRFQAHIDNTVSAPAYASQTNYFTSVRAGAIYQPTDWQSYYFSYGTSFDPSLEALTVTNATQNLSPESTKSYEVGSKWDLFGGNLSVNSAFFQQEMDNARTQVSSTEYELEGDIRVRGFQTGVTGHITNKWQVFGAYTYMDGTILKALDGTQGKTPANTPRNTLTLWTTYAFTPHWEVGGGPTYMSSRYAAPNNYVQVGGYTRWDATAAYHEKKWDVRLNLLNLTNKFYYDSLIQSDGGRSVPGIGRTFLATFDYRL
ncbi:TonB-dependent receptor [Paraburkholderia caballeronis]|uniref:TonB-dependent receptor n=1 Tax=Paraburkholderia caballeronis TaxID=416943 RepID=UPI0010667836|nr:TonB-dependent siderophore receptor [Paraburkholderia caballeronis]TDV04004.1 catecholate siderophore receptor [Paraburkholderia caballeronis]TDV07097.1 catecholate siderophore receptor [Paraburkholderia caballeronis]TDV17794.1 catecholate siderophore receptor [Paraburkholderia caballeronis]